MQKTYARINWQNYPKIDTPLNENNLNKIDYSLNEVDNRVIELGDKKLDITTANGLIKRIELNENTGVFTITYLNGATVKIDTLLEKLAINFDYDAESQKLIIYLSDGTTKEVDMSELITQYEFLDSDQIDFSVESGKVTAVVENGSITREKIDPDYLAQIDIQVAAADKSAKDADASAIAAAKSANESELSAHRSEEYSKTAKDLVDTASRIMSAVEFMMGEDGHLYYRTENDNIAFRINQETGNLEFEIITR